MELTGTVAWVAGASSGIGAAAARDLARGDGAVAIWARRGERLRAVPGGNMLVAPLDALERDRAEIVFPARMALLMKTARLLPARAWTALRGRT